GRPGLPVPGAGHESTAAAVSLRSALRSGGPEVGRTWSRGHVPVSEFFTKNCYLLGFAPWDRSRRTGGEVPVETAPCLIQWLGHAVSFISPDGEAVAVEEKPGRARPRELVQDSLGRDSRGACGAGLTGPAGGRDRADAVAGQRPVFDLDPYDLAHGGVVHRRSSKTHEHADANFVILLAMVAAETPQVFLVDDDPSVRKSLTRLLKGAGWEVESFASGQEFLAQPRPDRPSCLLLDVRMPGLTGSDLQDALAEVGGAAVLRDRREQARVKEIRASRR